MDTLSGNTLIQLLNNLSPKNILVVGDLMLDQYIWGNVERISPEGPIPVLRVDDEEFRLGGAANVAVNIKHLKCSVFPVGLVGMDHSGDKLLKILADLDISTEGIVRHKSFQTIVKQRAITAQQQLLRIDYESSLRPDSSLQQSLQKKIEKLMPEIHAVVLSDYAKGVLGRELIAAIITLAHEKEIPVICDPAKGVDFNDYKGITSIKPNRIETEQSTGMTLDSKEAVLKAAASLKKICNSTFVTVSLDKDGILYYKDDSDYSFLASNVPEVFDVVGAGDTLISTLSVLLANDVSPLQSTYIANIAAGLETSHVGVVPVPWIEIINHIGGDSLSRKITTISKLLADLKTGNGTSLIFTNGYFDNISAGHLRFLLEIDKLPGNLVVAINSDACIKRQKGAFPLLKEMDRARLLASMENVQHVIVFEDDDASDLIKQLKPKIVVKGEQFKDQKIPEQAAIQETGASIEYIPHFAWESPSSH